MFLSYLSVFVVCTLHLDNNLLSSPWNNTAVRIFGDPSVARVVVRMTDLVGEERAGGLADEEREAKRRAERYVAALLSRPEQLESLPILIQRASAKLASSEAMLASAMHSQLEGVNLGLGNLARALGELDGVQGGLKEMEEGLGKVPGLVAALQEGKGAESKHSQLAAAQGSLDILAKLPETVKAALVMLDEGNLLEAHSLFGDLEGAREEVLWEVQRRGGGGEGTASYFQPLEELAEALESQIGMTMVRAIETVRREPSQLVSALRVVEREEAADEAGRLRQQQTGFLPPCRPRMWRRKALEKLREGVRQRVDGGSLEDGRETDKMWLVRQLEVVRRTTLEDLRVTKHHLAPCCPPSYAIFQHMVGLYHEAVTRKILDIMDKGLEGNEYVSLLQWVVTVYPGKELLGSPALGLQPTLIPQLLSEQELEDLIAAYIAFLSDNFSTWLENSIRQETEDWRSDSPPDEDAEGAFYTAGPVLVFRMVQESLEVAATVSEELVQRCLALGVRQVGKYASLLRVSLVELKEEQSSSPAPLYTQYLTALANNSVKFVSLSQETRSTWWKPGLSPPDPESAGSFEQLLWSYQELGEEAVNALLEEATTVIEDPFGDLFTEEWRLGLGEVVGRICGTLNNYFEGYHRLGDSGFGRLHRAVQERLAVKYISCMLQASRRRVVLSSDVERRETRERVREDVEHFKEFLHAVAGDRLEVEDSAFSSVEQLGEVVGAEEEMLSLELVTLATRHTDITEEHLSCLLIFRYHSSAVCENIKNVSSMPSSRALVYLKNAAKFLRGQPKAEAQSLASEILIDLGGSSGPLQAPSIFSKVLYFDY